jgi:hypothetical protein
MPADRARRRARSRQPTAADRSVTAVVPAVLGTGTEGAASVVFLNAVAGERMWAYLQTDSLSQDAEEFRSQALPDVPR